MASLFGVGAPEVLVIGVVSLLVFGPKGLAEVAKSLGQSLRAFQPTIRELQEVSRDFKQTIEREIGLDELNPQKKEPAPVVNENAIVEELTAQLELLQSEKEAREAAAADDVPRETEDADVRPPTEPTTGKPSTVEPAKASQDADRVVPEAVNNVGVPND